MEYMKSNYTILDMQRVYDVLKRGIEFPKKSALITFDDGYKDNFTNAYPILIKHKIPAIFFLTSGNIDERELFWWDILRYAIKKIYAATKMNDIILDIGGKKTFSVRNLVHMENYLKEVPSSTRKAAIAKLIDDYSVDIQSELVEEQLLTWQEIREMADGGMDFGSHTVDHSILTRMPLEEAQWQISKSKEKIEEEIGKEIFSFAYPNGTPKDYNLEISDYLRRRGFIAAFATRPILYSTGNDAMTIGRIGVPDDENLFSALISGFPGDIGRISSLPYRYFQNEYVNNENSRFFQLISQ